MLNLQEVITGILIAVSAASVSAQVVDENDFSDSAMNVLGGASAPLGEGLTVDNFVITMGSATGRAWGGLPVETGDLVISA